MKEVKTEVKTYLIRAHCECGGEFTQDGFVYTSNPPMYPHHCSDCGNQEVFYVEYPRTVIE